MVGRSPSIGGTRLTTGRKRIELVVGGKGEIYTTEEIRRVVGIQPGSKLLADVEDRQLILRPKENAASLLAKARFEVPPISPRELSRVRKKLAEDLGKRS